MKKTLTFNQLSKFRISPKHYEHYVNNKEAQELDIKENIFYDALVCYLLDNLSDTSQYNKKYIVLKDSDLPFRVKEREKFKKDFAKAYLDKIVIEQYYHDLIINVHKNILSGVVKNAVQNGNDYGTVQKKDDKTGVFLECKLPWIPSGKSLINFKISKSVSPFTFEKSIFNNGYHNEAAFNIQILGPEKTTVLIVGLETEAPFTCQPFLLPNEAIQAAHKENRMLIDLLHWCNMHVYYPNYSEFQQLKNIYKSKELRYQDIDTTMCELDTFLQENIGYHPIETPPWIF